MGGFYGRGMCGGVDIALHTHMHIHVLILHTHTHTRAHTWVDNSHTRAHTRVDIALHTIFHGRGWYEWWGMLVFGFYDGEEGAHCDVIAFFDV